MRITQRGLYICREDATLIFRECYIRRCDLPHWCEFGGTMSERVLVTGGFGLVGSQTVRRLAADGHHVVATDLGSPTQCKAAGSLPAGAEARWAALTDPGE